MLATRIIPVLLTAHDRLVKGECFDSARVVGHAQQAAEVHQARSVDELILLDVRATLDNRGPNIQAIERLASTCFMPLTVGGGVTSLQHIRDLLHHGADKVSIGTAAWYDPQLIYEASQRFGAQAVVVSVDTVQRGNTWHLTTHCATRYLDADAVRHAVNMAKLGAGELLLNSVDRDGTMRGYDLGFIKQVAANVDIPVVACGGCGSYEHMLEAIEAGASAVAAGAFFQWTDATPKEAARWLASKGVETRI